MDFKEADLQLRRLLFESKKEDVFEKTVEFLHSNFSYYSWVGIYFVEGNELVLGPWRGPEATEHVRIPVGEGICGSAAESGKTEIVADVTADTRYLACFVSTRSEIVVPIKKNSKVVGEIDIDSDEIGAFTVQDKLFLEQVASFLSHFIK